MGDDQSEDMYTALLEDFLQYAWAIIANAGGGDWTKETAEWQTAAAKWREQYDSVLPAMSGPK